MAVLSYSYKQEHRNWDFGKDVYAQKCQIVILIPSESVLCVSALGKQERTRVSLEDVSHYEDLLLVSPTHNDTHTHTHTHTHTQCFRETTFTLAVTLSVFHSQGKSAQSSKLWVSVCFEVDDNKVIVLDVDVLTSTCVFDSRGMCVIAAQKQS